MVYHKYFYDNVINKRLKSTYTPFGLSKFRKTFQLRGLNRNAKFIDSLFFVLQDILFRQTHPKIIFVKALAFLFVIHIMKISSKKI